MSNPADESAPSAPTPYVLTRQMGGYTLVTDHTLCVKEAVGDLCVDCWRFLPPGHDWPDVTPEPLRPLASAG